MRIAIVFGTRPEIIKLSAFVNLASSRPDVELAIIHTGQHYSYNLSERFLEDLDLPHVTENIEVGSLERLDQMRSMVRGLAGPLDEFDPGLVIVQGDTNSALAGAIAARNGGYRVAHIEAGLRCFDLDMVEEINRTAADRISDICFAPTPTAVGNLADEGVPSERVMMVGNTIVETVTENLAVARERSDIVSDMGLEPDSFVLITAHRQENVDDEARLDGLISALERVDIPMVYPIHPRTLEKVVEFELLHRLDSIERLMLTDPLSYWDFLNLARHSRLIITDSGGIQEECTIFKRPVVITRDSTERPEILGTFGVLAGSDPEAIVSAVVGFDRDYEAVIDRMRRTPSPYGDGLASDRILEVALRHFN